MSTELDAASRELLERARAQSHKLAEERTANLSPLRLPTRDASPWPARAARSTRPLALALAGLAMVLLASGAFALVRRARQAVPVPTAFEVRDQPPAPRPAGAPATRSTPPAMPVAPPAPRVGAAAKRAPAPPAARPIHVPPVSQPPASARPLLHPDGELILVPPHAVSPPLFNPEEWKSTRSPPRD